MKTFLVAGVPALVLAVAAASPASRRPASGVSAPYVADTTLALAARPTVVAFFSVPASALADQPALPMVIEDFQFYLQRAERALDSLAVDRREVYGEGVRLSFEGREWALPLGTGLPIGYYLWSPTAADYLCRGVRSDRDLVSLVAEYLEAPRSGPGAALARCEQVEESLGGP